MLSPLQQISNLIPSLTKKDATLARKYYDNRDWENLKDLTWSALERLENAYAKEQLPEKYRGLDIDKIRELALLCFDYYTLIFPEELELEEVEDDFEDQEDY